MSIYARLAAALLIAATIFGANWKGKVDGRAERAAEVATLEARSADKDAAIVAQNASIAKLKAESAAKVANADKALKEAQKRTAAGRQEIAEILALKPVGNVCEAAEKLLGEIE